MFFGLLVQSAGLGTCFKKRSGLRVHVQAASPVSKGACKLTGNSAKGWVHG